MTDAVRELGDNAQDKGFNLEKQDHRNPYDLNRKQKVLRTIVLFATFIGLGMSTAILGPTLLDLMLLTDSTIDEITWGTTSYSIGILAGACILGYLVERMLPSLLMSIITFILAAVTPIVPYMPNLISYIAVCFIWGIGAGSIDAGGNVILVKIWQKDNGPFIQALHFIWAVGATISPLLTEPFLAPKATDSQSEPMNRTSANSTSANMTNRTIESLKSDSEIHYPYLIVGLWVAFTFIGNIIVFIKDKTKNNASPLWAVKRAFSVNEPDEKKKIESNNSEDKGNKTNKCLKAALLALLLLFYLFYIVLESVFGGFTSTFVVNELEWSKSQGALVTTVYWGSFCVVRGLSIPLARFASPRAMQIGNLATAIVSTVILCVCVRDYPVTIWITTALLGGSSASVFPTQISWIQQHMDFTGSVSTIIFIGVSIGLTISPPIVGNLITVFGYMTIPYTITAAWCACTVCYILLEIVSRRLPVHGH